jgi:hypothetical protein
VVPAVVETAMLPDAPAATMALRDVDELMVKDLTGVPPTETEVAFSKPVPEMST